jgi:hypothetical protein
MQLNLNSETGICTAIALIHFAVIGLSYIRSWSIAPLLWTLRIDLTIMCGYALWRVYTLVGLGHPLSSIDMLYFATVEVFVLSLSFFPLPSWLVWLVYGVSTLMINAIAIFFLTFRMRLF